MEPDDRDVFEAEACRPAGDGEANAVVEENEEVDPAAAEQAFIAGLIARGEAAPPDEHGKLPAGATHELIEDDDGTTTVRRRRFSAF